jgi:hypothetical protein
MVNEHTLGVCAAGFKSSSLFIRISYLFRDIALRIMVVHLSSEQLMSVRIWQGVYIYIYISEYSISEY